MSIKIIVSNKKARYNYSITETFEAGLVLMGSEVKSIRQGNVSLGDAFVCFKGHEAFLQNAHIQAYKAGSYNNHDPERLRKILLHKVELDKIRGRVIEKGLVAIPLKLYLKKGRVKVEIGLGRGKKLHDKREALKTKDIKRELRKYKS